MSTPDWEAQETLANAQSMYRRVLSAWVLDVARLRRSGLHRPSRRRCASMMACPSDRPETLAYTYPHQAASQMLGWRRKAA